MNERIRELALQADSHALATIGNLWIGWEEKNPGWEDCRDQKFAELIVRECANYINERTLDWDADLRWIFNDGSGDMAVDVDDLLNRHFGVEE